MTTLHTTLAKALSTQFSTRVNNAIVCAGQTYSYQEMYFAAQSLIKNMTLGHGEKITPLGIFCDKSIGNYIAILACLLCSRTYVPINPKAPIERIHFILNESGCEQLFINSPSNQQINDFSFTQKIISQNNIDWKNKTPALIFHETSFHGSSFHGSMQNAYIMYTSGSTGMPKGVPISLSNLTHYINNIAEVVVVNENDKCTQLFDLTFDLSVHDIVITWLAGACLCIPSTTDTFAPAKYITHHNISVWFSVPSTIDIMHRLKLLKANAFPSIRLSLFCGEALAGISVQHWLQAAINTEAINLYGPTEATIACCYFPIDKQLTQQPTSIPIGKPFGNNRTTIIDGELNLAGPQLTEGYINHCEKNKAVFHYHNNTRWYRSGDNAIEDKNKILIHLGRTDDQVKINGHRIELQEITHTIKKFGGDWNVKAVAWSPEKNQAPLIYLFVENPEQHTTHEQRQAIEASLNTVFTQHLIDYMRPKKIRWIDSLPLNSNGKVDKNRLLAILETSHAY